MSEPLATYARRVAAPLERAWENVLDWEHLPYLHHESFCGIELEESGAWGWRARVRVPPREKPGELCIEVRVDREAGVYHTRTLAGPGAGRRSSARAGGLRGGAAAPPDREALLRDRYWGKRDSRIV